MNHLLVSGDFNIHLEKSYASDFLVRPYSLHHNILSSIRVLRLACVTPPALGFLISTLNNRFHSGASWDQNNPVFYQRYPDVTKKF